MNKHWKPGWFSSTLITKTTYWARFLLNAYNQRHNSNYGGTAALGLINIKKSGAVPVINERSQKTVQVSCPATISELLFTQLVGYSSNIFSPLRNDLGLFETDIHMRLVRFLAIFNGAHGS